MSTQLVSYKDYVAGWLDSSIQEFLETFPLSGEATKFALITCLDSNSDPASLLKTGPELKPLRRKAVALGRGLLLPTELLLPGVSSPRIFFGFDEIWFFASDRVDPKPASASIVGPARIDRRRLGALGPWMLSNACALALADGEGLNVVVKAEGLLRNVVGHSLRQPQPA